MDYRLSVWNENNQCCEAGSFTYLHYRAENPAICDLSFRKFVTTVVFDGAFLVPVRSGPGRKLTLEGVVKIAATSATPVKTPYKNSVLVWTPITEFIFERYRKESATKVYFRGFPLNATQAEISSVFNEYGPLQYVYIMCESAVKKRSNRQGYVIYESRASLERLLFQKNTLSFNGIPIHIEEYKSKNSKVMIDNLCGIPAKLKGNNESSYYRSQDNFSLHPETMYEAPSICERRPFNNLLTRDFSKTNNPLLIQITNLKKPGMSVINIHQKGSVDKNSSLRKVFRFVSKIEANTKETNIRFNKRSRIADPAQHSHL